MRIKKVSRKDVKVLNLPGRDAWVLISKDSVGARSLSFVEVHKKPGECTRIPHAHLDFEEVIYVKDGLAELWVEGDFTRVEEGEAVLIPAQAKHAIRNVGAPVLKLLAAFPFPDRSKGYVEYDNDTIPGWTSTGGDIRDQDLIP